MQGITNLYLFPKGMADIGHKVYVIACKREGERFFQRINGIFIERLPMKSPVSKNLFYRILFFLCNQKYYTFDEY